MNELILAEGAEIDHASVLKLVRAHQLDIEEFGRVRFEIQPFETSGKTGSPVLGSQEQQEFCPIAFETRKGSALPQGGFAKATSRRTK